MFCTNCGKEIGEGMAFCQYCGKPVNASVSMKESVKSNSGSFLRSIQEKAKSVSDSISTAAEEVQNKAKEKNTQGEKANVNVNAFGKQVAGATKWSTGMQQGRFKQDSFFNGLASVNGNVIVDRLTGVNYLFVWQGTSNASGLTVLVDENGKPLVTKEDIIEFCNTEENELEQNEDGHAE